MKLETGSSTTTTPSKPTKSFSENQETSVIDQAKPELLLQENRLYHCLSKKLIQFIITAKAIKIIQTSY
jgi:hypothetical protein